MFLAVVLALDAMAVSVGLGGRRRDVLRGMEAMSLGRSSRKRYPDYVQPA